MFQTIFSLIIWSI